MPLYLAATPDRLTRARAVTPRLAHVAYRLGPGSELLVAPLPPALRGGPVERKREKSCHVRPPP